MLTMRHCAFAVASTLATVAATAALSPAASANAFTGTYDGWTYIQDATHDSTGGRNKYEIFGLASKQVGNQLHFAINANMGLAGVHESRAADKNISFGDLFLHFDNGKQFGIRFAPGNDSGVNKTGVFTDITTKDVTAQNAGWARQTQYKNNQPDARFYGDERDDDFFSNSAHRAAATVIKTGDFIGEITAPKVDLLDFSKAFGGAQVGKETVGFSFDLTPAMVGRFDAKLLLECINDGIALTSETTKVPEPASVLGLVGVAALAGTQIRRKKAQQA
jgi:hypothetical protein